MKTDAAQTWALIRDFYAFAIVGVLGFVVNVAALYALDPLLGLYPAAVGAYFVAATFTWAANRAWTFRGRSQAPSHRQWAIYLSANLVGFVLNCGTCLALILLVPICRSYPFLAVAAGTAAGLSTNFFLSRQVVFR